MSNDIVSIGFCPIATEEINDYLKNTNLSARPHGRVHIFGDKRILSENKVIIADEKPASANGIKIQGSPSLKKQKHILQQKRKYSGTNPNQNNRCEIALLDKKIAFDVQGFFQSNLEVLEKAERGEVDPLTIIADQYDLVCNGVELSSGAVRNHDPDIMIKAFEMVRLGEEDVKAKFPAMYNAFCYGAPPHAGIAPGVDRMVMLLAAEPSIREIIPFPMNKNAQDLMMGAPSAVEQKQLDELNIRLNLNQCRLILLWLLAWHQVWHLEWLWFNPQQLW